MSELFFVTRSRMRFSGANLKALLESMLGELCKDGSDRQVLLEIIEAESLSANDSAPKAATTTMLRMKFTGRPWFREKIAIEKRAEIMCAQDLNLRVRSQGVGIIFPARSAQVLLDTIQSLSDEEQLELSCYAQGEANVLQVAQLSGSSPRFGYSYRWIAETVKYEPLRCGGN